MRYGFFSREPILGIRFWDSLWLGASLILASLLLLPTIGLPVFACFTTAVLLHLQGVGRGLSFAPALRWVLLLFNLGCVWWIHGSFVGMEPGIAVFMALFSVKILELRNLREYQSAIVLGYFLLFCTLYVSHELFAFLYAGAVFCLLTATLLRAHSIGHERPGPLIRACASMLLQTVPIIVLLFLFFPRFPEGFGLQIFRKQTTGMSDRLSPGAVENLIEDGSLAFRVRFAEGTPMLRLPHYWRGVVLWHCEGLEWDRGEFREIAVPHLSEAERALLIEQEIVLEPHGERWLLALDRPYLGPEGSSLRSGHYLLSNAPINHRRLYRVFSGNLPGALSPRERKVALMVDEQEVPEAIRALAQSWQGTPRERVQAAQRYFAENGFRYTLASGSYPEGNGWKMMERFLFERKRGFCSHYAAAFSSLMRLAGVPSRAIIGYAGGERNPVGEFLSIHQSDAHAWSEVWLDGEGWVRIDPTLYVPNANLASNAPTREAVAEQEAAAFTGDQEAVARAPWIKRFQYEWAALNYRWTRWVLGYDQDAQRSFLRSLGLRSVATGLVVLVLTVSLAMGLLWLGLWWRNYLREDPLVQAYRRLCRKLARVAPARRASEPPGRYQERVLTVRPDLRPLLEPLFARYQRLQYAPWQEADFKAALRAFQREVRQLVIPARGGD